MEESSGLKQTIAQLHKNTFKRVLGVFELFAIGYGDLGSSIYYALGVTALFALGATPVALGLAGIGISKRMGSDSIVGTCVSAVGAAMYKLGDFYGKKAEKRTAQLKRIGEISKTKGSGVTV